jgi:hypothetical protein
MMGVWTPETCWAVNKRLDNKLEKLLHLVGDLFELFDVVRTYKLYKHVSNFQCVWRYSCLKLARAVPIFVCGDEWKAESTKKK